MQLIVAEKPSVARDLARVLGVRGKASRHAIESADRVITWCIGHLVELDEPVAYDARWKAWRLDTLPMLPATFKLRPVASTSDQLAVVRGLLRDRRFSEVVNACDAGREGELIFRYVYDLAGSTLAVKRLWISSMTDESIQQGFASLRPGREFDALGAAARCRSEADWLVGLNATRAVTVRHRHGPSSGDKSPLYSIGRVQTPTLAILVERERALQSFVPRDYFEVRGTFRTGIVAADAPDSFVATWAFDRSTRLARRDLADELCARAAQHGAAADPAGPRVAEIKRKKSREAPPLLFDLTSLQRTANRAFGLSAAETLECAQALYERHKLLTYPRTNARYLSKDIAAELPKLFRGLSALNDYAVFAQTLLADPPKPTKRVFDDTKVEDHHAIIPTGKSSGLDALSRDERRIFDLVVRRFLGAFFPDAEFALTEVVVRVGPGPLPAPKPAPRAAAKAPDAQAAGPEVDETLLDKLPPAPDRFSVRGRIRLVAGWQEVAGFGADEREGDGPVGLPPLEEGQALDGAFAAQAKQTRPPPRHNEATLLAAMESAGRAIEDEELRAAMKDSGLGTPATRAATIETLLKRGFIRREGKQLVPTEQGMALISALPVPDLASPELTGSWEARLARIARGEDSREAFMRDIARYVTDAVDAIRRAPVNQVMARGAATEKPLPTKPVAARPPPPARSAPAKASVRKATPPVDLATVTCPQCKQGHLVAGKRGWGCSRWRQGCAFVVWFEVAGATLTEADLRELCTKGRTRKRKDAAGVSSRLVLDLSAPREAGAARLDRS